MASSRSATFRKAGLLILLLAAAIVVAFQYMPQEEPAEMAAPTKKRAPAPQAPPSVPPRQEQAPRGEQPSPQSPEPQKSPAKPVPPLDYEKPPATVFVSSSPSDAATPAALGLTNSLPATAGESVSEPPPARHMPSGPIPLKVSRYARHWIAKYDTDGDGSLGAAEWKQMAGAPANIDYNADGVITADELSAYWADYGRNRRMRLTGSMVEAAAEAPLWIPTAEQEARAAAEQAAEKAAAKPAADDSVLPVALPDDSEDPAALAADAAEEPEEPAPAEKPASPPNARRFVTPKSRLAGLPDWFLARDSNGDGQLTLAEFAPNGSAQRLAEFKRLDRNGDGVLTPEECPR